MGTGASELVRGEQLGAGAVVQWYSARMPNIITTTGKKAVRRSTNWRGAIGSPNTASRVVRNGCHTGESWQRPEPVPRGDGLSGEGIVLCWAHRGGHVQPAFTECLCSLCSKCWVSSAGQASAWGVCIVLGNMGVNRWVEWTSGALPGEESRGS